MKDTKKDEIVEEVADKIAPLGVTAGVTRTSDEVPQNSELGGKNSDEHVPTKEEVKEVLGEKSSKDETSLENSKDKKDSTNNEEVTETFEVKKEGEPVKEIKTSGKIEKKHSTNEQEKKQDLILRNILIVLGVTVALFLMFLIFYNSVRTSNYEDVKFDVVHEGNLIFYKNSIPIYEDNRHTADYNFYLRKNPPQTGKIPFEGELIFRKAMVINMSNDFDCDGDGIISMINLAKPFELIGTTIIKDPNATCDTQDRYNYLNFVSGEENSIVQTSPSCYTATVKECEILDVTERIMLETFTEIDRVDKETEKVKLA